MSYIIRKICHSRISFENLIIGLLLLSGSFTVDPEVGVTLVASTIYFLLFLRYIVKNITPNISVIELTFFIGINTIFLAHYLFLNIPIYGNNLFQLYTLLIIPLYLLKDSDCSRLLEYNSFILKIFFFLIAYSLWKGLSLHLWFGNKNVIGFIILLLFITIRRKSNLDGFITLFSLITLNLKGGIIILSTYYLYKIAKRYNFKRLFVILLLILSPFLLLYDKVRLSSYHFFIIHLIENPKQLVLGMGNNSASIIADNKSSEGINYHHIIHKFDHVHSEFIELVLQGGLILLGLFIFYTILLVRQKRNNVQNFLLIIILAIGSYYSSIRHIALSSLVPLFLLGAGFKFNDLLIGKNIKRLFYFINIIFTSVFFIESIKAFYSDMQLRNLYNHPETAIDFDRGNDSKESLHLYTKLNYLCVSPNSNLQEFMHCYEQLEKLHPNYKNATSIVSFVLFNYGYREEAYKLARDQTELRYYDFNSLSNSVFYSMSISKDRTILEIEKLLFRAISIQNKISKLNITSKFKENYFTIHQEQELIHIDLNKIATDCLNARFKHPKELNHFLRGLIEEIFIRNLNISDIKILKD